MSDQVEEHLVSPQALRKVVRKAKLNPDWFCEYWLQSPNDAWQSKLMNAVADLNRAALGRPTLHNHALKTRFSVAACHGPGKTHTLAKLMHWFNFTRRGRIPCTAPKEKQVTTRLWPEFRKLLAGARPGYRDLVNVDQTKITWAGDQDWCALVEAASQPDNLQGLHDKHLMFCIDEASGVNELMFPVIEGSLTTPGAIMVMIGNPTKNTGEFYASHNQRSSSDLYYRVQISAHDSPRVSKTWAEQMLKKYGRGSPIYKIRVLGQFADSAPNQLISLAWLEAAHVSEKSEWDDGSFPRLRVIVDVSDGGEDESVVTIQEHRDTNTLLWRVSRFSFEASVSPLETARVAERMAQEWSQRLGYQMRDVQFIVDAIGVGAGTAGTLIELGYAVIQYRGGASSDDVKLFRNRRTQSYLAWRDALAAGTFLIHEEAIAKEDWDDFCHQALSIRSKPGQERVEDLETKQEMKARGEKSPDMPDAVAMGYVGVLPALQAAGGDVSGIIVNDSQFEEYDHGLL